MTTPPQPPPRTSSGTFSANGGSSLGRDVRLGVGALALIADFVLYYLEHVAAKPVLPLGTHDVILHITWAACALLLMDPKRTIELIGSVKDKIPLIGGGK